MDDTPRRVTNDADDVAARATEPMRGNADDSVDADQRTRAIRTEIEETRVELTETIDAIQEKLNPRNIVANATDRVKSAATERVREMADTASETAQQAVDYTRSAASDVTDRVRQNPMPLALIGVGAAWLLARGERSSYRRRDNEYAHEYGSELTRDERLYGSRSEQGLMARIRNNPVPVALAGVGLSWLAFSSGESRDWRSSSTWNDASRQGNSSGLSGSGAPGSGMTEGLSDSASQMASRTRDYVSDAAGSMRRMASRRQNQFEHMVRDNPLLVGVGALIIGAAFGMAVPESDTENELMGETRDTMVDRARTMARDAANQVHDAAGSVADAAGKIAGKTVS